MKRIITLAVLAILSVNCVLLQAQSYDKLWKQLDEARSKSLPQTAIKIAEDIFAKAQKEKNAGQMFKAYTARTAWQETLTPDSIYVHIKQLEEWVKSEKNPKTQAILHSLLATEYADYASQNYWSLRQRTAVIDEPSDDMREWSANMFEDKVMQHTEAALKDSLLLLNASSKEYLPFVVLGDASEYYKHDLYHLLVSQAVKALNSLRYEYQLAEERINTIYANAIDIYKKRGNVEGWLLVSLERLRKDSYNFDEKAREAYFNKLTELIEATKDKEISAEAYHKLAQFYRRKQDIVKAVEILDETIARFPKYKRINMLKSLRRELTKPEVTLWTSRAMYPNEKVTLNVGHKELDGFTLNCFKVNLPVTSELVRNRKLSTILTNHAQKVSSKHYALKRTGDYKITNTTLDFEAPGVGLYIMQLVPDAKNIKTNERLFHVSSLRLITHQLVNNRRFIMAVLDAETGRPVKDATIRLFTNDKGKHKEAVSLTTNKGGMAWADCNDALRYYTIEKGDDVATELQNISVTSIRLGGEKSEYHTVLLTDRSIYRPGQTVLVKGVIYNKNEKNNARVIADDDDNLILKDSNGRVISEQKVTTNEFGSYTASFTLPAGGLNGSYSIHADNGSTYFRVEEYKRPTFEVTLEKPERSYQLNDTVEVAGVAKSFAGVAVQNTQLNYKMERMVYRGWGRLGFDNEIIDSGSMDIADSGEFKIPVCLQADKTKAISDYLMYTFTLSVTVTNQAGETVTETIALNAGNRSMMLELELAERINKDDSIKALFSAVNLSNKPIEVTGTYELYRYSDYEKQTIEDKPVLTDTFVTNKNTELFAWQSLPSGGYKIIAKANDEQGREVVKEQSVILFSLKDTRAPVESKMWFYPINTEFDEETPASFVFGTSEEDVYMFREIYTNNHRLEFHHGYFDDSIGRFELPYKEEYGKGVTVNYHFMKKGQFYTQSFELKKKEPKKILTAKWKVFRDKLRPGQQEEWQLVLTNPDNTPADAELLALMYDASLDKIWKRDQQLRVYYDRSLWNSTWNFNALRSNYFYPVTKNTRLEYPNLVYDHFWTINEGRIELKYVAPESSVQIRGMSGAVMKSTAEDAMSRAMPEADGMFLNVAFEEEELGSVDNTAEATSTLRTNFSETAFFYPQLRTNEAGEIVISFTMPESLTRWKFCGYAHTKEMFTGMLEGEAVTSKEFMITPNLPRFVRVGDNTSVATTVANLTEEYMSGKVTLTLFDPITEKVIATQKQPFSVEKGKTTAVSFNFTATDKYDMIACRLVAEGGNFSDGEQHLLPVLSNKEFITESVAMPIRGNEKREFSLGHLFNNNSKTATNRKLTVEFSGNPMWYAVQALPSVVQPTNDNAISWASAFYANELAAHILNTTPKLKNMVEVWKAQGGTKETFLSNLQKNQDVKNILLEESPWLMEATSEREQMQRIATLFDLNNVQNNRVSAINKLKELQLADGSWTWFKGMNGSWYITTYVVEQLARLENLTGKALDGDMLTMKQQAFGYLHDEADKEYKRLLKLEEKEEKVKGISNTALNYLYLIAVSGAKTPEKNEAACQYFLSKISESITTMSVGEKARAAIVLHKNNKAQETSDFMASIKEHLIKTDEQGMHFAFNDHLYGWINLKIPTHVYAMEAFDVVTGDEATIEEMKLWLLKQKQTQQWSSPVATANAIYALLKRGDSAMLDSRGEVNIRLNNKTLNTLAPADKSVPGMAYIKESFTDKSMVGKPTKVTVEKKDAGIAWGAVYAQYQEEIGHVSAYGKELSVEKKLYVERLVDNTKQLFPITETTKLSVGDKVISRITIRLDRAMDFVQLKDQRSACFEPELNLSGYRWGAGTGYYVEVKDASTNFFFDSLVKGVYVLEYAYRVSRTGSYEGGLATMQSAYAPEFSAHSGSVRVAVGE
ncbi:alpha-2-macroglobulin [Bacteroides sp. 214]|uniref:alpha-2-macroglobulin family protein n=1 Tax=Bacteroides sp. 214 TaxID=2302935 RepID=UPI0013D6765D|nr:alpha-2-macroglobulin family protein [Bacteroides sp. 214]NDW13680.1 alpha-2-macroglobulin [Bacteroides sp. 214]